jgi:hypothetical protein
MEARATTAVNARAEGVGARFRRLAGAGAFAVSCVQLVFRNGRSSSRCLKAFAVDRSSVAAP